MFGALSLLLVAGMVSMAVNALSVSAVSSQEVVDPGFNLDPSQLKTFSAKHSGSKSLAQTLNDEQESRLFMVGETHTRYDHHLVQLEVLKLMHKQSPNLAIGVEWFQQPFQQHLDDFIAGRIDEKQMLHRTGYYDRWRYDYRLYQPIMQYARDNGIPVLALNASRELSQALRKYAPEDLPADLKAQLPDSYDWSDEAYAAELRTFYDMHPEFPGKFEDFLRGQLTWDESMAQRSADYLRDNPSHRLLVLAGSGHIRNGSGIPNRVQRRVAIDPVTLLISDDPAQLDTGSADYLVLSPERQLERVGLIGAFLETQGQALVVRGFAENSALHDAGLEEGVVIVGIDDQEVENNADFRFSMMDKRAGDRINLHYLDNAMADKQEARSVTLQLR